MLLVSACLPPPHVAEHPDHVLQSDHSQLCGGGGEGGGGAGVGSGAHCSLLWKDILKITQDLGSISATRTLYLSQHRQDE